MGSGGGGEGGHLSVKIQLLYGQSVKIFGIMRAEAKFSLCELACEKQPLPTTVQFSIVHARNSSRHSQAKLIVTSVVKWREFLGNKKHCDNSDLLSKTHAKLETGKEKEKNPFFKFIRPDFWTDLNGCRQRLLFARQLTPRKYSPCSKGKLSQLISKNVC